MRKGWMFGVVLVLVGVVLVGSSRASFAEFFGCDDQHHARSSYSRAPSFASASPFSHEFSAQSRPNITVYPRNRQTSPGRHAVRQCRSWLAKEYRVSGPVIVPRMQCWWE
jgi:hypothetical protein